jgi:hypothetical protein
MEITKYIPHSLIDHIYPRIDKHNESYIRIVLKDQSQYNTYKFIQTDANGITGEFIKVNF